MPIVKLLSGQEIEVLTDEEKKWWNESRKKYEAELRFTEHTDRLDLDRLLIHELMIFRWTKSLASGLDHDGLSFNETEVKKSLREYSQEVAKIKEQLAMTRSAREKADHDSVGAYIVKLKQRAKQFGVHRVKQVNKAIALVNELSSIVGAYDRSDEVERRKLGFTSEADIVQWVRDVLIPEFQVIDADFRKIQATWIRDL